MSEYNGIDDCSLKDIFLLHGSERRFSKGQYLLEKGIAATELWYIIKGTVRAYCTGYNGEEITLFHISEGNIIYYEALMVDSHVIQSAQAITNVVVYTLVANKFMNYWQPDASKMSVFMSQIVDRIILLHENIMSSRFPEGKKRVAYFLYRAYLRSGPVLAYTNDQIAAITGINRVSVNRILNEFSKLEFIALGYRHINIVAPQQLAEVFGSIGFFSSQQSLPENTKTRNSSAAEKAKKSENQ